MKRLILAFLLVSCAHAGTTLTESFGDTGTGVCFGAYTGCNQRWGIAGTGQTIEDARGGATGKRLRMNTTTGTAFTTGTFPAITAGTTFDLSFKFRQAASSLANFGAQQFVSAATTSAGTTFAFRIRLRKDSTNYFLLADGTASSDYIGISLNTDYTVAVHVAAGAAASSISIDGTTCGSPSAETATCQQFTAASQPVKAIVYGVGTGTTAQDYEVDDLSIDSTAGGGWPWSMLFTSENGADNATIDATVLNHADATKAGNGTWTVSGAAGMKISTSGQLNLPASVTVAGTSYDGTGTRGWYTPANLGAVGGNPKGQYAFTTTYPGVKARFMVRVNAADQPTQYGYSILNMGAAGNDLMALHYHPANAGCPGAYGSGGSYTCCTGVHTGCETQGYFYLWTGKPEALGSGATGKVGPVTNPGTYCIEARYLAGDKHSLKIYQSDCTTLIGTLEFAAANAAQCAGAGDPFVCCTGAGTGCTASLLPTVAIFGRPGAEPGYTDPGGWYVDNVLLDYAWAGDTASTVRRRWVIADLLDGWTGSGALVLNDTGILFRREKATDPLRYQYTTDGRNVTSGVLDAR